MDIDLNDDGSPKEAIENPAPIENNNEPQLVIPTAEDLAPSPAPAPPSFNSDEAPYGLKADGTPAKKRGRKPGGTTASPLPDLDSVTPAKPRPVTSSQSPKPAVIVTDYRAMGQQAANLWFNVPQIFLGEEWAPDKDEIPLVAKGFTDYFESTGITVFPPGIQLAIILGGYTIGKAAKPTIRERITGWMGKARGLVPWKK